MVTMGIYSELSFDRTQCKHCNKLLHKNYGGKRTRHTYCEWDGELAWGTFVDVICSNCGGVNEIFWAADMLPPVPGRKGLFGCVPTV